MPKKVKGRKRKQAGGDDEVARAKGGRVTVPMSRYSTRKLEDVSDHGQVFGEAKRTKELYRACHRPNMFEPVYKRSINQMVPAINTYEATTSTCMRGAGIFVSTNGVVKGRVSKTARKKGEKLVVGSAASKVPVRIMTTA